MKQNDRNLFWPRRKACIFDVSMEEEWQPNSWDENAYRFVESFWLFERVCTRRIQWKALSPMIYVIMIHIIDDKDNIPSDQIIYEAN